MAGQEDELQTTPVHRSLIRSDREHVMGMERPLVGLLGMVVFILGWTLMSIPTTTIAIILIIIGIPVLRAMAKRDPVFSKVLMRRLAQPREYLAHAHHTGILRTPLPQARRK